MRVCLSVGVSPVMQLAGNLYDVLKPLHAGIDLNVFSFVSRFWNCFKALRFSFPGFDSQEI